MVSTNHTVEYDEVDIKTHPYKRWVQRVGMHNPEYLGYGVERIFHESYPVRLTKNNERAMLHPPTGSIFVYHKKREGVVVSTVYQEFQTDINDDHLAACSDCDLKYDKGADDECPWCDDD